MAYFDGNVARGQWDTVYCDGCAEGPGYPENPNGLVPFSRWFDGTPHQERPWRWAPWLVGKPCDHCGRQI